MEAPPERALARTFRGLLRDPRTRTLGGLVGDPRIRRRAIATGILVVTVVFAAAPYVSMYGSRRSVAPVGWDTPTYVWRTRIVAAFGPDVLRDASAYPFHSNGANPDRPGLPVLGSLLSSVGVSPWRFMFVVPALAAIAAALAAGAFALRVLGEPPWAFPMFGLAVAWSPQLAVTANGYLDNLVVAAVLLAALTAALTAASERGGPRRRTRRLAARRAPAHGRDAAGANERAGGTVPRPSDPWAAIFGSTDPRAGTASAVLLFVGALLIHWVFAAYAVVVVIATAVALLLAARRPTLASLRGTPSERLLLVAAASVAVWALALPFAPGGPAWFSTKPRAQFLANLSNQVPFYRLAVTIPLAIAGGIVLWRSRSPFASSRRRALWLLAVWLVPLGSGWLLSSLGGPVPIQRLLAFSLPVPLLCAAAAAAAARFAARLRLRRPFASLAAAAVGATAIAAAAVAAGPPLAHAKSGPNAAELARRHAVVRYLGDASDGAPFIVAVDGSQPGNDYRAIPALHLLRAAMPAPLSLRVRIYVGAPRSLLSGLPTEGRSAAFERTAAMYWTPLATATRRRGVAIAMDPYYPHVRALARRGIGSPLARDARVIRGPAPRPAAATWTPRIVTGWDVAVATGVAVLVLGLAGAGWSIALSRSVGLVEIALAPAVGIAASILGGLVWSGVGLGLRGLAGLFGIGLVAAVGWVPAARRRLLPSAGPRRQDSASSASTTRSTSSTEL